MEKKQNFLHMTILHVENSKESTKTKKDLLELIYEETHPMFLNQKTIQFSSVQSLSRVRLFATPWIAARQASLSITNSRSSLKHTSIESVMPSSHLILCRPRLLLPLIPPSIKSFPMSQLFAWGGQSIGVSALASVLPKNTQDLSPLEWTSWISLQLKRLCSLSWSKDLKQSLSKSQLVCLLCRNW